MNVNFIATVELELTPDELTQLKRLSLIKGVSVGDCARVCLMARCMEELEAHVPTPAT